MKKVLVGATVALLSLNAVAAPNINHGNPSGTDRVRTKDGASCDQAVATGKSFVMGVYGSDGDADRYYWDSPGSNRYDNNDKGIYAGIQIQFGGAERIDCTRMYNNEMDRKDIELDLLKAQYEQELQLMADEMKRLERRSNLNFTE